MNFLSANITTICHSLAKPCYEGCRNFKEMISPAIQNTSVLLFGLSAVPIINGVAQTGMLISEVTRRCFHRENEREMYQVYLIDDERKKTRLLTNKELASLGLNAISNIAIGAMGVVVGVFLLEIPSNLNQKNCTDLGNACEKGCIEFIDDIIHHG